MLTCDLVGREVELNLAVNDDLESIGETAFSTLHPELEDVGASCREIFHCLMEAGVFRIACEDGAWRTIGETVTGQAGEVRVASGFARVPLIVLPCGTGASSTPDHASVETTVD